MTIETVGNFIKTALNKALTYTTPDNVARYIEMQSAIGNPPWKNNDLQERITNITKCIYGIRNDHTMKFNHNDFTFNVNDNHVNIVENVFFKRIYFKIPIEDLKLDNQTIILKIIYPKREPITK